MSETASGSEKPASRTEDFIDVYIAPAELFRRRIDGKFGLALLVLVVAFAVLWFATRNAMQPIFEAEFARGMATNPNLTPEQIEAAKRMAGVFGSIGVIIGLPITALLLGLAIWIVGRLVSARLSYFQAVTIATFAYFPRLIELVINGAQALLLDESRLTSRFAVSLGVGRLLDAQATAPTILAFLGRIDLFTIWVTILIAIGLKQMGRITGGQAAIGAAIVWVVGSLPTLLPAMMQR